VAGGRPERRNAPGAADYRGGSWRSALTGKEADMRRMEGRHHVLVGDEHRMQRAAAARSRFRSPGCSRALVR
jgi:hypothetical protein